MCARQGGTHDRYEYVRKFTLDRGTKFIELSQTITDMPGDVYQVVIKLLALPYSGTAVANLTLGAQV